MNEEIVNQSCSSIGGLFDFMVVISGMIIAVTMIGNSVILAVNIFTMLEKIGFENTRIGKFIKRILIDG